ncbi:MAG: IS1380 family transposase [Gammaproteobacteria bacterium]|nr:IS1380 family transposase [Gammaproteobacteria bacterium]
MKSSRSEIRRKFHTLPTLRFEEQQLTSFSGLVVFQRLFEYLDLKNRVRRCFRHLKVSPIFGHASIVLLLVVHMLLGYRELRHLRCYEDDPLVRRLLGLKRLPDVATVSRTLSAMDEQSVARLQDLVGSLVLERIAALGLQRVTLDFDGSVIGTGRYAEGTAVGFNRKKKGQRSYYPLFCTVAQTGQVLDILHRSGNVHDSNGAQRFILNCIAQVRSALPNVIIEVRMDGAFFSDAIVTALDRTGVEYTISAPFERFAELKTRIEKRRIWHRLDEQCDFFESTWKPNSWQQRYRFIFVRQFSRIQYKQPVQLDLFVPYEYGYAFKVVLTNKSLTAARVVAFHNGRGSQEGIFAELKSQNQMAYVPTRTWHGNQVYLLAAVMAHNLTRELQMVVRKPARTTLQKRPALWDFEQIDTLRRRIVQRAGRLIRPKGKLTLSMNANDSVKNELLHYLDAIDKAA